MTATTADRLAWAADVAAVLAALPVVQADALRLSYFEHLNEHEIAARMGIALTSARIASAAGLRNLGQALRTPADPPPR